MKKLFNTFRPLSPLQGVRGFVLFLFLFLFLLPLWGLGGLFAQPAVYPVQLNVQLLPPFTPCLSDYVNDDYSRLRVIALQRDMSQHNYLFALRITI
ncbi:MAG: hypothetical protein FWC39_13130, partial [Bacteroidetes bacterium]|nr:hypothetical protein [Bacteroidota bacterium]